MDTNNGKPIQSKSPLPETSSTSVDSTAQNGYTDGGDWQEEVYQKIQGMKELYLPELLEMYQKISSKLQELDSLPKQPKSEQFDKLKLFKCTLERAIQFLQVQKGNILPGFKEKTAGYEKEIISFIYANRPRNKPVSQLQQGQGPPYHDMHSMQQPQSQMNQVQSHREDQMNPQLQSMNVQSSVGTLQQNNMTSLQQNFMPALSGVSTTLEPIINTLQSHSDMLQHQCTKLKLGQQMLETQLMKQQYQQQQIQQELIQTQQILQQLKQLQQQQKNQLYQSKGALPETSSTSVDSAALANGGDWQEEVYQKIKTMKEQYLPELLEMYQKIAGKLQQIDSLPQQPESELLDKLKLFKTALERAIQFLQVPKEHFAWVYGEDGSL